MRPRAQRYIAVFLRCIRSSVCPGNNIFARITEEFMIQRIQSIYLLAGAILTGLVLIFPLARFGNHNSGELVLYAFQSVPPGMPSSPSHAGFPYIVGASLLIFLISLFTYSNRSTQARWVRFNFLVLALSMILLTMYFSNSAELAMGKASFKPFFFGVPVALLCNWLAARAIKKDEELVRSVDRIR